MFNETIQEVGRKQAKNIILKRSPYGKFWVFDDATGKYIGIDNSTGEAYNEEFDTKEDAIKWLESPAENHA
jgi:DNA uptake protein ComE-like DNA-binding protein